MSITTVFLWKDNLYCTVYFNCGMGSCILQYWACAIYCFWKKLLFLQEFETKQ